MTVALSSHFWPAVAAAFALILVGTGNATAEASTAGANPSGMSLVPFGEALFHSKALSLDQTLACASCHGADSGLSGVDPKAIGVFGQIGVRRAPALINLYAAKHLMWDGRAESLVLQIPMPLQSPIEMAIDWDRALPNLRADPGMGAFRRMFDDQAVDRSEIVAALAAYVGSLVSGNSPFDRYYFRSDEAAIGDAAKRGFRVFSRKARCVSCHLVDGASAMLTDDNFHSVGIGWDGRNYRDAGRASVTADPADVGKFKTPTLRNVAERPYLMHDGSMTSLREVIDYYNRGGNEGALNKDGRVVRLFLTSEEVDDLVAFLQALSAPIVSNDPAVSGAALPLGLEPLRYRQSKIQ